MTFSQLKGYNMRKIFLEKSNTECVGETFPDPFLKKQNGAYLWINSFIQFVFIACPSQGLWNYIETKLQTICFYLI